MKGMLKGSQSGARRVPPLSTGEAKNLEQRVQILNGLRQIVEEGLQPAALSANGRKELKEAVELVCGSLSQRTLTRLSEQEVSVRCITASGTYLCDSYCSDMPLSEACVEFTVENRI